LEENKNIQTKIDFTSEAFKKYFANTSWLFAEKVFRVGVGAFVIISITNYLGAAQFGLYSYALSFVGLFSVIGGLGLEGILTRELVITPEKRDSLLGTAVLMRVAGALFTILLIGIALILTKHDGFTSLLVMIISASTLFQTFNVIEYYFQSKILSKYAVAAQSASFFLSSIIKLLLIVFKYPLLYFAVITSAEFLFLAVGFVLMYRKQKLKLFDWKFDFALAKNLLKDSWPLILSGLVIAIYVKIDQVMLKQMLSDEAVGQYAAAVRLCEAWYFVPTIVTVSLFPAILNAKKESEVIYLNRMQKLYDLLAWIAIAIALPTTFLSRFIIDILYKPEYAPASPVLTIYIWAGVAVFLGVASSQYLIAENLTKLSFYRTFLGMVANVGLNFWLIPKFGIIGSAVATFVSYTLATIAFGFTEKTFSHLIMMSKSILFFNLIKLVIERVSPSKRKN
jgi:O-antigen/teichoic acid export membrane protein